jgi:hypothetical protein
MLFTRKKLADRTFSLERDLGQTRGSANSRLSRKARPSQAEDSGAEAKIVTLELRARCALKTF